MSRKNFKFLLMIFSLSKFAFNYKPNYIAIPQSTIYKVYVLVNWNVLSNPQLNHNSAQQKNYRMPWWPLPRKGNPLSMKRRKNRKLTPSHHLNEQHSSINESNFASNMACNVASNNASNIASSIASTIESTIASNIVSNIASNNASNIASLLVLE